MWLTAELLTCQLPPKQPRPIGTCSLKTDSRTDDTRSQQVPCFVTASCCVWITCTFKLNWSLFSDVLHISTEQLELHNFAWTILLFGFRQMVHKYFYLKLLFVRGIFLFSINMHNNLHCVKLEASFCKYECVAYLVLGRVAKNMLLKRTDMSLIYRDTETLTVISMQRVRKHCFLVNYGIVWMMSP